jgi:SAM-dependent methyltransferase
LDVGCGNGKFLHGLSQQTGCAVQGVDLSESAVQAAKAGYGLDVFHGPLEKAGFPDDYFDAITAWWYLEHVPHPAAALREMARILKPGGICVFGVPNARSFAARAFRGRWYHLDCPRHLSLFTPRSLRILLPHAGLGLRRLVFDKSPWGLIGSMAYAAGGSGEASKRWRDKFWLRQILLPFTALLGLTGWGDTMVAYAEKLPSKAG